LSPEELELLDIVGQKLLDKDHGELLQVTDEQLEPEESKEE
jgi:hypothetical protein